MPCFHPLQGFRSRKRNPSGKRSIVFNPIEGFIDLPVFVPCNQCIGCRFKYSRSWAVRCVHEASLYKNNCFLTLTYSDENLPEFGSLVRKHPQDFLKRLRRKYGVGIRFFGCGEYGDQNERPHYHILLFNHDFPDKRKWKKSRNTKAVNFLYVSEELNKLWPFGHAYIGSVSFESAAYVARYVVKKLNVSKASSEGDRAAYYSKHFIGFNPSTGEYLGERIPEFPMMSRNPGVAYAWFKQFYKDCYPSDFVTLKGKKFSLPRYYDNMFEMDFPKEYSKVRAKRLKAALDFIEEGGDNRLQAREQIQIIRANKLQRSYENGI